MLLFQATSQVPAVSAASPTRGADRDHTDHTAIGGAVAVAPAPIKDARPNGGGGQAGAITDPSVHGAPSWEAAQAPQTRTELTSLRSETSRTYANPDGTFDLEMASAPINFKDAAGTWQEIDLTLVDDGKGNYHPRGVGHAVVIRGVPAAGLVEIGDGADSFRIRANSSAPGSRSGARVSFAKTGAPSLYANATEDGAEFGAVFADPSVPGTVTFTVDAPSGSSAIANPDGSVTFLRDGAFIGRIDAPVLLAGPLDIGVENNPVAVTVVASNPAQDLVEASATPSGEPAITGGDSPTTTPSPALSPAPEASASGSAKPSESAGPSAAPAPRSSADPMPAPTATIGTVASPAPSPAPEASASAEPTAEPTATPSADPNKPAPSAAFDITYTIDAAYYGAPDTTFPLTLDPTICMVYGDDSTHCSAAYTHGDPDGFDTYISSTQHGTYPAGTGSMLRVGYDNDAVENDAGTNWGNMRSQIVFFDADEPNYPYLPDGALITDAQLRLRLADKTGANGAQIMTRLVKKPGFGGDVTWDQMSTRIDSAYDSDPVNLCAAPCYQFLDVTAGVRANYTTRSSDWRGAFGFQIRYSDATESSDHKESVFYKTSHSVNPEIRRPELVISYEIMNTGLDFDPTLGPAYAPSSMIAGVANVLPIKIENKGQSTNDWNQCTGTSDTDCYEVGYRWMNARGKFTGPRNYADLPADLPRGTTSPLVGLPVTPPGTPGQYTLALDVVHRFGGSAGTYVFASDWADLDLYNARNKKVLSNDVTRWTGASKVERSEFSISVQGGSQAVNAQTVPTGDGGQIGIDLSTANLTYLGDTWLGFADLLPLGLSYAYHSSVAEPCAGYQGVLGACGWTTPWDERIVGGPNQTGVDYEYVDPSGQRYLVDTDGNGQLISSAPVLLERPRVTFGDEVLQLGTGATGLVTTPLFSGQYATKYDANANKLIGFPNATSPVPLNAYQNVRFAMRGDSGVASSGMCFTIDNLTDSEKADRKFCATLGTNWTTSYDQIQFNNDAINNAWHYFDFNLWDQVNSIDAFGDEKDDYAVVAVQVQSPGGYAGKFVYLDAARFEASRAFVASGSSLPAWTSGGSGVTLDGTDTPTGTGTALKFTGAATCDGTCLTVGGGLNQKPFTSWWWKKTGGQTAAISFHLSDEFKGIDKGWITYYAGPTPPAGAEHPIQIATVAPTTWTQVTRNLEEDGRQVLGIFQSRAAKTRPAQANPVSMTGYKVLPGDGAALRLDLVSYHSIPDAAELTTTGGGDELGHPDATGDTTWCPAEVRPCVTYDFRATYSDGTVHYFNDQGLLTRIEDLDRNHQDLAWTISPTRRGLAAYSLTITSPVAIRAAADGLAVTTGGFANRELNVTTGADDGTGAAGNITVRIDETLGSQDSDGSHPTNDASTRAAVFEIAKPTTNSVLQSGLTATSTGSKQWLGSTFYPAEGGNAVVAGTFTPSGASRTIGISCTGNADVSTTSTSSTSFSLAIPSGTSVTGCRAFLSTSAATVTANGVSIAYIPLSGDLRAVDPVRGTKESTTASTSTAFCAAPTTVTTANECAVFVVDASHRIIEVRDPRYTTANDDALAIGWSAVQMTANPAGPNPAGDTRTRPVSITDKAGSPDKTLLQILRWDGLNGAGLYRRPVYQTAVNTLDANHPTAQIQEISPEGTVRIVYANVACGTTDCLASPPSSGDAALATKVLTRTELDGLAHVNKVTTYRCTGDEIKDDGIGAAAITICASGVPQASVTRSGSNAGAKVDNYASPLAAAEVTWSQDAEQYYASIRDSGGMNPDLYRTETTYDGWHDVVQTRTPVLNQQATPYQATVLDTPGLYDYWPFDQLVGRPGVPDARDTPNVAPAGASRPASLTNQYATLTTTGGLVRAANNQAWSLTTAESASSAASAVTGSFSVETWAAATDEAATWQGILGSRIAGVDGGFGLSFQNADAAGGKGFLIDVGTTSGWLTTATVPFEWRPGRFYHLVATVNTVTKTVTLYVNGTAAGGASWSATGTPVLASPANNLFRMGKDGETNLLGSIDDTSTYTAVLDAATVRAHYAAGVGIVDTVSATAHDRERHPVYGGDQYLANGDFEDATTNGWRSAGGGSFTASALTVRSGSYSGKLTGTGESAWGVASLVPGQTARVQFSDNVASTNGSLSWVVEYWDRTANGGSGAWSAFGAATSGTDAWDAEAGAYWRTRAFDVTVPMTGDGRIRTMFTQTTNTVAYIDDVIVVTRWGKHAYNANGTLDYAETLPLSPSASGATIKASSSYSPAAAGGIGSAILPAIVPTSTIANDVTGTSAAPDEDITITTHYDAWGRPVGGTDALDQPLARDASGNAAAVTVYATNQTDVAETWTPTGVKTTTTYDAVGNVLTETRPSTALTTVDVDRAGRTIKVVAPDGTSTTTEYNAAGLVVVTRVGNTTASASDGTATLTVYDAAGRPAEVHLDCEPNADRDGCTAGLDAMTRAFFDATGSAVVSRTFPGSGASTGARTTVGHYESVTDASGSAGDVRLTRGAPTAIQLPIAPTATTAPLCPDSGSQRCNSAEVSQVVGEITIPAHDLAGRAIFTQDPYGTLSRAYYDLAGNPVRTVSAYVPGVASNSDTNVVADVVYTLAGATGTAVAAGSRRLNADGSVIDTDALFTITSYDALGRAVLVTAYDGGTAISDTKTVYDKAGRTVRTSGAAPIDTSGSSPIRTPDNQRAWTGTQYDAYGRAARTVTHQSTGTNPPASMAFAALEGDITGWSGASTGWFTNGNATLASSTAEAASGTRSLGVTLNATDGYAGAWWDLSGRTYTVGHTYSARFHVLMPAGTVYDAFLGRDVSGGSNHGAAQGVIGTGAWQAVTLSWTPTATVTSPVHLAIRRPTAGTAMTFYVDDVVVWDTAGLDNDIVGAETGYDTSGRIVASVLPPGDPAVDEPLVTTTSYDLLDRATSVTVNANPNKAGSYDAVVASEPSLTHDWRMAETNGQAPGDVIGGSHATIITGTPTQNAAGPFSNAPGTSAGATTINGSTLRVAAGAGSRLSGPEITLEAWVKPGTFNPSSPAIQSILGSELGDGDDALIRVGDGVTVANNRRFMCILGINGDVGIIAPSDAVAATWYHVACTYGASSGVMRLYVNGVEVGNRSVSGGHDVVATGAIGLGDNPSFAGRALTGSLAGAATYAQALSAGTIATHYRVATAAASTDTNLTTAAVYDRHGQATTSVSPTGIAAVVTYDHAGRATAVTANAQNGVPSSPGGVVGDDDARSTYAYDALGELTGYCPPTVAATCNPANGSDATAWHYAFDTMGRQTTTTPPVNGSVLTDLNLTQTVYDTRGHVAVSCSAPVGTLDCAAAANVLRTVNTDPDKLGRITSTATYKDAGGTPIATTQSSYRPDGQLATTTATSAGIIDGGTDTLTYTYGASLNRLSAITRGAVVTALTYVPDVNGFGQVESRTDGTDGQVTFGYDWAGRTTSVDGPAASDTVSYAYRLDSLLAARTIPTTPQEQQAVAYDVLRRPTTITRSGAGSGTISREYTRSGATAADDRNLPGGPDLLHGGAGGAYKATYAYDGLGRLTAEKIGGTTERSYRYDLDGNRTRRVDGTTTTDYTYDTTDQLVSQSVATPPSSGNYAYDAYGNLTRKVENSGTTTVMDYADGAHLTSLTIGGGPAATLRYDALGRTSSRTQGSLAETYRYVGTSETVRAISDGTTVRTSLIDNAGARLSWTSGGVTAWTLFDELGSLVGLVGPTGSLTETYRTDGYGQAMRGTTQTAITAGARNPFRFRGALNLGTDAEPLLEMGARFYAPSAGAWTSLDTYAGSAQDPASMNRFLYALANPTSLVDPDGHLAHWCDPSKYDNCSMAGYNPGRDGAIPKPKDQGGGNGGGGGTTGGGSKTGGGYLLVAADPAAPAGNPCPACHETRTRPSATSCAAQGWPDTLFCNETYREQHSSACVLSHDSHCTWSAARRDAWAQHHRELMAAFRDAFLEALPGGFAAGVVFTLVCSAASAGLATAACVAVAVIGTGAAAVTVAVNCAPGGSDMQCASSLGSTAGGIAGGLAGGGAVYTLKPQPVIAESAPVVNRQGVPYPQVVDPRTGKPIPLPEGTTHRVPLDARTSWDGRMDRAAFIKEWIDRGYPVPEGGWSVYQIHHILPLERGGTNAFDNLVPVRVELPLINDHNLYTQWWYHLGE